MQNLLFGVCATCFGAAVGTTFGFLLTPHVPGLMWAIPAGEFVISLFAFVVADRFDLL